MPWICSNAPFVEALRLVTVTNTPDVASIALDTIVNACDAAPAVVNPVKVTTPTRTFDVTVAVGLATVDVAGCNATIPAALSAIPPEPDCIVVVDVVLVEPNVTVLALAPLAIVT